MKPPLLPLITTSDAGQRARKLMYRFFVNDRTHAEWAANPRHDNMLLNLAQREVDIARHLAMRLVNNPAASSDMLFMLSDGLRELCGLEQFNHRTTQSLLLLAELVAEEAATRPPAQQVAP